MWPSCLCYTWFVLFSWTWVDQEHESSESWPRASNVVLISARVAPHRPQCPPLPPEVLVPAGFLSCFYSPHPPVAWGLIPQATKVPRSAEAFRGTSPCLLTDDVHTHEALQNCGYPVSEAKKKSIMFSAMRPTADAIADADARLFNITLWIRSSTHARGRRQGWSSPQTTSAGEGSTSSGLP